MLGNRFELKDTPKRQALLNIVTKWKMDSTNNTDADTELVALLVNSCDPASIASKKPECCAAELGKEEEEKNYETPALSSSMNPAMIDTNENYSAILKDEPIDRDATDIVSTPTLKPNARSAARRISRLQRRTKYDLAFKQMEELGSFADIRMKLELSNPEIAFATHEILAGPDRFSYENWDGSHPISLGADGRRLLLRKLRSVFSMDCEKWQAVFQQNELGDVRNVFTVATVPMLLKIAHLMGPDVWNYALKCACFTHQCSALSGKDSDGRSDNDCAVNDYGADESKTHKITTPTRSFLMKKTDVSVSSTGEGESETFPNRNVPPPTNDNGKSPTKRRRKLPSKYSPKVSPAQANTRSSPMKLSSQLQQPSPNTLSPISPLKGGQRSRSNGGTTPVRSQDSAKHDLASAAPFPAAASPATHEVHRYRRKRKQPLQEHIQNTAVGTSARSSSSPSEKDSEVDDDSEREFTTLLETVQMEKLRKRQQLAYDGLLLAASNVVSQDLVSDISTFDMKDKLIDHSRNGFCDTACTGNDKSYENSRTNNEKETRSASTATDPALSNSFNSSYNKNFLDEHNCSEKPEARKRSQLYEDSHHYSNSTCRITQLTEQCLYAEFLQCIASLRLTEFVFQSLKNRSSTEGSINGEEDSTADLDESQLHELTQCSSDQMKIFVEMIELMYKAHNTMPLLSLSKDPLGLRLSKRTTNRTKNRNRPT